MPSPSVVRVVSRRCVKPPSRPRELIPLTSWDVAMLSAEYIQKGLLFAAPPLLSGSDLVDHLEAALAGCLASYYPVAGRFATEQHRDGEGNVVGCSVSIDCDGQGVEMVHAVAHGVAVSDIIPRNSSDDVPRVVQSLFPLDGAVNHDAHEVPLFVIQIIELSDGGVFLAFGYNHALSDGTAFWDLINAWAHIARKLLLKRDALTAAPPLLKRWSADGSDPPAPVVLKGYADVSSLIERPQSNPPPLREKMLHFSAESLEALKDKARQELLAAGDTAGAAALTKFQVLSSLLWRSITRARGLADEHTVCRAAINNRGRLRPPLPKEYFGNTIYAIATPGVRASELLERGHGWAAPRRWAAPWRRTRTPTSASACRRGWPSPWCTRPASSTPTAP